MNERLRRFLRGLALLCARRPRTVIFAWLAAALVGIVALPTLQSRLDESGFLVEGSESAHVRALVERDFPAVGASVQVALPAGPGARKAAEQVAATLKRDEGVRDVELLRPGSAGDPAVLGLIPRTSSNRASDRIPAWREAAEVAAGGHPVFVGGTPAYYADVNRLTREDLSAAERIGLPLTFIVLIVAFGSLAAATIPLMIGVAGLALAFGLLLVLSEAASLQVFVLNLAVLVGFGVGVDYALLMVSRIRFELEKGRDPTSAVAVAGEQAGHAIVVSGVAVLLSLAGLFAIGIDSFDGMAMGTMIAVAAMVVAALSLLPAVAVLAHRRLRARPARTRWPPWRWARPSSRTLALTVRRPILVALPALALLVVTALPALGIEFRMPGTRILPPEADSRRAAALVDEAVGPGGSSPILVAVSNASTRPGREAARRIQATAAALPGVSRTRSYLRSSDLRSSDGETGLIEVEVADDPEAAAAQDAVARLREVAGEGEVGGLPAERFDEVARYGSRLPFAVAAVLLSTGLMLLVAFRSVLLPLKAIIATLLSAAAALGAVTWVFQQGHLADLFGFQQIEGVPAFLPIFLFPIIFGLSMDYEVFLLSRIAEERRGGLDDRAAIVAGVTRTARTITGAAAVMISVALAFASTDLLPTQATGFGMSVAVLLDATVVRLALVPATLALLGGAAWWWPGQRRRSGERMTESDPAPQP